MNAQGKITSIVGSIAMVAVPEIEKLSVGDEVTVMINQKTILPNLKTAESRMPKLTINVNNYGKTETVRDIRKILARILSKLDGEQTATFHLNIILDEYAIKDTTRATE